MRLLLFTTGQPHQSTVALDDEFRVVVAFMKIGLRTEQFRAKLRYVVSLCVNVDDLTLVINYLKRDCSLSFNRQCSGDSLYWCLFSMFE